MKLALVTDAWFPQTNGVVRTLATTVEHLQRQGVDVEVFSPQGFRTVACPTYPEIRLALFAGQSLGRRLDVYEPDAVHGAARRVLVATPSMQRQLEQRGFRNVVRWSRGVDAELFRPREKSFLDFPRPIWLYLGRVAVEKGIADFLALDLPGTKLVIGDGPARPKLELDYPAARFVGYKHGEELARHVAACDAFVFPSRTDTFGLVLLEAMACGLPVAAYPVTGPMDVVLHGVTGFFDRDLRSAALRCLSLDPAACRAHALQYSWEACTQQFRSALAQMPVAPPSSAQATSAV